MPTFILAYDLGTTGNKATIFDATGSIIASAVSSYPTHYPRPGWAEQSAADWWRSTRDATRELLGKGVDPADIAAIGFSGHMMGCLPVDGSGAPLHNSLIHADGRSEAACEMLRERLGDEELYRITGNRIAPQYTPAKIAWFRSEQPELFERTALFLQAKDYLAFRLSGELGVTDYSDASLSGLMDINRKVWSADVLEAVGITESRLPQVVPAATVVGKVTREAAQATGLAEGTPVAMGGGDGACATVGAGALAPGEAYNYCGTTSWISMVSERPLIDPEMRIFNLLDLDPGKANVLGTMQCAGGSYQWFTEQIGAGGTRSDVTPEGDQFGPLNALAQTAPPGSEKLFFLPYLMGERSPIWDVNARGVFFGLSLSHTRAHLTRAVLEGVAYALKSICEVMEGQGGKFESLSLIGGMAMGEAFREILAGVLDKRLVLPADPEESTARGAGIAAAVACGLLGDYSDARSWIRQKGEVTPDPGDVALYARHFAVWKGLYPALKQSFRDAADLV
jgi:xylulokinase